MNYFCIIPPLYNFLINTITDEDLVLFVVPKESAVLIASEYTIEFTTITDGIMNKNIEI